MSKGEDLIVRILKKSHIKFEREKQFDDLGGGHYRYDFYCPDIKGKRVIFEFNGRQHYEQVKRFQPTILDFRRAQEHDRRKISYALANGIQIYCIPYWDEGALHTLDDLFNPTYLARNRWHNDEVWKKKGGKK